MERSEKANPRPPIRSDADIRHVVDVFYDGIDEDPLLGPYFARLDMSSHLPRMYRFWSSVVFQSGVYRGRPFDAHLRLDGLRSEHFARWLQRFEATVDASFAGDRADHMKQKARQIAAIFQIKMGIDPYG